MESNIKFPGLFLVLCILITGCMDSSFNLFGMHGLAHQKKREQYRTLYNDLNSQLKTFKAKLKMMEGKVDSYNNSRPSMSTSYIPEDVFSDSEGRVKGKVDTVRTNQSSDAKNMQISLKRLPMEIIVFMKSY